MAELDKNGHEILDDTPVAIPLRLTRPPTIVDQVRRLVRGAMSDLAQSQGNESFEEADDFDIGDDYEPDSPYEEHFEPASWNAFVDEMAPVPGPSLDGPPKPSEGGGDPVKSEEPKA